ncbi:hypothetical protein PM082_022155 [Marasmius tenuissimus]|nr:hypothetical protein PM082_022155 [Marasmius tenuissimus]
MATKSEFWFLSRLPTWVKYLVNLLDRALVVVVMVHLSVLGIAFVIWAVIHSIVFWRSVWAYLVETWHTKIQAKNPLESRLPSKALASASQENKKKEDSAMVVPPSEELDVLSHTTYPPTLSVPSKRKREDCSTKIASDRITQAGAQHELSTPGTVTVEEQAENISTGASPSETLPAPSTKAQQDQAVISKFLWSLVTSAGNRQAASSTPSGAPSNLVKRRTALAPGKRKGRPVLPPLQTTEQHSKIIEATPSVSGARSVGRAECHEPQTEPRDAIEENLSRSLLADCDVREEAVVLVKRRRLADDEESPRAHNDDEDNIKETENAGVGEFGEELFHSFDAGSASGSSESISIVTHPGPSDVGDNSKGVVIYREPSPASQSTTLRPRAYAERVDLARKFLYA